MGIFGEYGDGDWWLARRAAKRLGLRDKGQVQRTGSSLRTAEIHAFCHTRLRVGIDNNEGAQKYCWRCEQIVVKFVQPAPTSSILRDKEEPLYGSSSVEGGEGSDGDSDDDNVVDFRR